MARGVLRRTKFPAFAGHVNEDRFFAHDGIDVCIAVSRESALYLPVIRRAAELSLEEIQAEIRSLVNKTRDGQLRPADLAGGCFTVSNLGMYPVDAFHMIVPPEQSGALAIGAIKEQPIVAEGSIVARPLCAVVLSVDHRMINGSQAACVGTRHPRMTTHPVRGPWRPKPTTF